MRKVIVISKGNMFEMWTTLTKMCKAHPEFSYPYLKNRRYPYEYKGLKFEIKHMNEIYLK